MFSLKLNIYFLSLIFISVSLNALAQSGPDPAGGLVIRVMDNGSGEPLEFAVIRIQSSTQDPLTAIANKKGEGRFNKINPGIYILEASYLGYKAHKEEAYIKPGSQITIRLQRLAFDIKEVVVTATESKGMGSSSKIGREAMQHLQPSSFSDLLELLPGGRSSDPSLGKPNLIHIREVPISSANYATSSLGTAFVIDGRPMSTNANIQYMTGAYQSDAASNQDIVNMGLDMRTISTDNIEGVDIVRGIPSVEYGDLTSGLVKIERKRGGRNLEARFKADMSSKLYYIGNGFENADGSMALNIDINLLDAKSDPRNSLENYKRIGGSLRFFRRWDNGKYIISYSPSVDYGGSFDNQKVDPDNSFGNIDKYKSTFSRYAFGNNFSVKSRSSESGFRKLELNTLVSYQKDNIERVRFVQLQRDTPAGVSTVEGENYGIYLPYKYTATQQVDGQPFNAYVKALSVFVIPIGRASNDIKAGVDWNMDKNYGEGQIFDPMRPCFPGISIRQRKYSDIPAQHTIAFFAEDYSIVPIGKFELGIMAGVRAAAMANLSNNYDMRGKFYFDPRINVRFSFPSTYLFGQLFTAEIYSGVGWHTKFPTMDQLYPALLYYDLVQLNYYHENPDFRRLNLKTYIVDPTNYDLGPARNLKYEIRGDVSLGGNRLSVTWFREDMKSGFRYTSEFASYTYKVFNSDQVDHLNLQAPPLLSTMPYEQVVALKANSTTTNGSRTLKDGVEFTFSSKRIKSIRTRITVSGAWFKTIYSNSQTVYYKPSAIIDGKEFQYVGVYHEDDGYVRETFNTNFMLDTDVAKLGLRFSASFQCLWCTANQSVEKNGIPFMYIDNSEQRHQFTEESAKDAYLQHLVRNYSDAQFVRSTIPFSMNVNFKATKTLYRDRIAVALFVNKLLDYNPDYTRGGMTIRRKVTPYFGMELNFKL